MQDKLYENTDHTTEEPVAPPDDLRSKTLELLEFDAVRLRVADFASFFPARQLALQLTPSYLSYQVEELQLQTAEGRALLDEIGDIYLQSTTDTATSVTRASLGGILTGRELLAIAETVEVHRRARQGVLSGRNIVPLLADMAEGITGLDDLRRQINARIGNRGEVVDNATTSLRTIRGQMRQSYDHLTDSLNRMIHSPLGQDALQDQVISVRGDRLVVQVKSEMRHRVPGIVHDASNTGATLFVEPFATVELGNSWRELSLEEEREIRRVLRDLSELVGQLADTIRLNDELTAKLDFILARARYSMSIRGVPALPRPLNRQNDPSLDDREMVVRLLNARHPLLGADAVPISLSIGPDWSVLVITGPNTGGKTVAMKTIGLLAMMHQSGLHVAAAEGSFLPVFDGVYADIGDQQSIEQSVSTFSSHMKNVVEILDEATSSSLVLLDELGTSTDPEEGSALAKAILTHLAEKKIDTIATTHHRNVAAFAEATPGMMNASVQLDSSTLRPTYHLTMGIPGRSYAMSVAASLGLTKDIMENAESLLEPQYMRFEDWLTELQKERDQLQAMLRDAEQQQAGAESLRSRLQEQIDYLIEHRDDILDSIRREALAQYEDVRRQLRRAEAAISWSPSHPSIRPPSIDIAQIRRELDAERQNIPAPTPVPRRSEPRPLEVRDAVQIRGLNLKGTIVSLSDQGREAEVNVGKVNLRVELSRLSRVDEEPVPESQPDIHVQLGPMLETTELDIRGLRAEESLIQLEDFLDKAVRDGLSSIRIIHGRGTGALRNAVREHLRRHPLVRSFDPEVRERGGNGATLVQLA